jgi:tRNA/rRNA methyltransferase
VKLRPVLVRPEQPRNAGAVMRAAANFAAERPCLVGVGHWGPEQLREMRVASSGAWEVLGPPRFVNELPEAVNDCAVVVGSTSRRRSEDDHVETPPGLFSRLARTDGTAALLLGPESCGLTRADFMFCHAFVRIPTAENFPSLNVAQAVAILLYQWQAVMAPSDPRQARTKIPDVGRQEIVLSLWNDLIETAGEWPQTRLPRARARARRLLHRALPDGEDLALLASLARGLMRRLRG